jgi:exosortase J
MSAFPDSTIGVQLERQYGLSPVQYAALASTLAVLGLSMIWFTVLSLWTLWTTDALKSIGMVIPLVSLMLVLRAWRTLSWRARGTWWGMVLLLITFVVVQFQQRAILILVISPHWYTYLPPPSVILFAYGSGVVLLLGGVQLYRVALFPILLLLFANPIPHVFSTLVDLPLQHASAHITRAFAMHLGQPLTPDHLRLMFTPDFGMFIAPGCNGIRGSVTMGFIALIAGYVYQFRWYSNALVVTGAILLGYVFNLARLCLLVLYYLVALHFTSLQDKAENADYLIGATLFLLATLILFAVIHRLRGVKIPSGFESATGSERGNLPERKANALYAQLAAMGVIVLLGCGGLARANAATNPYTVTLTGTAAEQFPPRLGDYTLTRSWTETQLAGSVVYVWAEYTPTDGGTPITLGISPVLAWHDPLICHFARGDDPLWHGQLAMATADFATASFSSAFYNDGVTEYLEAATICSGAVCGEFASERTHFGLLYTRLDSISLLHDAPMRPIPVLLRAEMEDTTMPADVARKQLTGSLRAFLASVRLDELTRPYGRQHP